ncbi:hypothetical protein E4656_11845 [Natronospirillum operosum]|uniref:Uncharacterized protein n=1 Tax=Natronospirillum operosum TaxID=2759953 RepID=A0A4Z0WD00_9GAMM|nr:hypothetical protein [Natronospirillum operosum]TGG92814.1 hypothetical protein E4656_11845 [Natronospirillum operosum]
MAQTTGDSVQQHLITTATDFIQTIEEQGFSTPFVQHCVFRQKLRQRPIQSIVSKHLCLILQRCRFA